jgi:methionyl-tRNA synthetase
MQKTFYLTTPIFYPNARLHMGHAYTATLCDILARYHRAQSEQTYFLTGADENTEKVVQSAHREGIAVTEYLDAIVAGFEALYQRLEISHDQFIRTTDQEKHWPGAIAMWEQLVESGDIYKKSYRGLYCVGSESFVTEKDLREGGLCPDHDELPQIVEEENYFFRLSKYTEKLKQKIERDELLITPASRKAEILSLLEGGLEDVSFSRPSHKMTLGIPVPGDASQVMYVWCDALTNYVSCAWLWQGRFGTPTDLLARERARHREGYSALPCCHLAGNAHVCRPPIAAHDPRAWHDHLGRQEDEQVARQRDRPTRLDRRVWRRSRALLFGAGGIAV